MKDRFNDIIDVEFTANMESQLDAVEEGRRNWKELLADFYQGFHRELTDAEAALEGVRLKVPDEVTEEKCELCGRNMVIKMGRFGQFLACPGFPDCKNATPLVERAEKEIQAGLCLLRLRECGVRLYELGCPHSRGLPQVRTEPVQEGGKRPYEALLHQRTV